MTVFYAFCRLIDDIADATDRPVEEKGSALARWRAWLRAPDPNEPPLANDVRVVMAKYSVPPEMLEEIIAGVEMDLSKSRYRTFEELRLYCYRVASAVGLVSIEIFGYRNPGCKQYAVELGLALQTTNIIRDVGKDLQSDRIYLPEEDLERFGYTEADLRQHQYDDRFVRLMQFEADRAHDFFKKAAALLPREDRRSMVAAEIMGSVYRALLRRMERDKFRVFEKNYRLNKLQKAGRITAQLLKFF
jgi:phytoene synthase